ncbi:TonB-dependent receptor plug domain-containing protein [Nitrincola alkalisediminis]|uniref:TonB-dependent receptor plug domain-containing protein n=1 Tax=Nitrincola alkalisediminis TaxID=1366656 RepID=UPI001875CED7|nr:TonB-dependent receptor [Nitrincola alkalisediminis]
MPNRPFSIRSFILLILLTACSCVSISYAQTDLIFPTENDFFTDIPVVTSATRLSQNLTEAPASITVIDKATITASGAITVPDLFRLVPGFQTFHVNTNKFGVTYHGFTNDFPNRLEVMIDGRSVYMPLISAPDWSSLGLHISDIERIEVIRGSNTATHGSNAFMGAINIITRHPAAEPRLHLSSTLGSLDTQMAHVRFTEANASGHYRVSLSHESNSGSKRFQDGGQRSYMSFAGSFSPTLQDQVDVWLGYDTGHITIGSLKAPSYRLYSIYTARRDYDADYQHLRWRRDLSDKTQINLTAYRSHVRLEEENKSLDDLLHSLISPSEYALWQLYPDLVRQSASYRKMQSLLDTNPGFRRLGEDGSTTQHDLQLAINHQEGKLQNTAGMGLRYDQGKSGILFQDGNVSSTRIRIFDHLQYSIKPNLILNMGALFEKQEGGSAAHSYRIGGNYRLTDNSTLRLGYSESERLPSLVERHHNFTLYNPDGSAYDTSVIASSNLKPEQINSSEIGFIHKFSHLPGYIDLRLFHEKVTQGIASYNLAVQEEHPSQRARQNRNIGEWRNQGIETQLKLQLNDDIWFLANYAYIDTDAVQWTNDGIGGGFFNRSMLSPKHTASLLINWSPAPDWQLSASHYFMGNVHWLEGDDKNAYNRTDVRLSKQWRIGAKQELETVVIVQNAFNKTYQEFYDYHDFERRTYLQLRLTY